MKFFDLIPANDKDKLKGYEEAFEHVLDENRICNVAITGSYSSGKSSLMNAFKAEYKDLKFINISLAHFNAFDDIESINEKRSDIENKIEYQIINQLFQQIPDKSVKLSKINGKHYHVNRKVSECLLICKCFFVTLTIGSIFYLINLNSNEKLCENYTSKNGFHITAKEMIICTCYLIIGLFIFMLVRQFFVNFSVTEIRKIGIKDHELEFNMEDQQSYFDKHLDEIVYLIIRSEADAIVFEDIDRFDQIEIFEKLRQINILVNLKLESQKTRSKRKIHKDYKRPIKFFYLLREDIFNNTEKVKFFDFIIPVVPVADSANAYDLILQRYKIINKEGQNQSSKIKNNQDTSKFKYNLSNQFMRDISLYLEDLRVINNIFNEYEIYHEILNIKSGDLDPNKLFSMIVYKNIFPKDFGMLQFNDGFVYHIFSLKNYIVEKITKDDKAKLEKIEDQIKELSDFVTQNEEELNVIDRYYYNNRGGNDYYNWSNKEKPRRRDIIKKYGSVPLSDLEKEKEEIQNEIARVSGYNLKDLLARIGLYTLIDEFDFLMKLGDEFYVKKTREDHYFGLLNYLLSYGYIDETYEDYMSYFYPNSLTPNDKRFVRKVKENRNRNELGQLYHLDSNHIENVIDSFIPEEFERVEMLNYELFRYMTSHTVGENLKYKQKNNNQAKNVADIYADKINHYFNALKKTHNMQFVIDALSISPISRNSVLTTLEKWTSFYYDTFEKIDIHNTAGLIDILYVTLLVVDHDLLGKVNKENCLKQFISNDPMFIHSARIINLIKEQDYNKFIDSLVYLKVKFTEISKEQVKKELLIRVYQNNLYELNQKNIELFIQQIKELAHLELTQLMTFISNNKNEYLSAYIIQNKKEFFKDYLTFEVDGITDSNDAIVDALNDTQIEMDSKRIYIEKLKTNVFDVTKIEDNELKTCLLNNKRLDYNKQNILYFYENDGLKQDLINFINSCSQNIKYGADDELTLKFFESCYKCKDLENDKYEQIINQMNSIKSFSTTNLTDDKMRILISNNKITFNDSNLNFLRANYKAGITVFLIKNNIDAYMVRVSKVIFGTLNKCSSSLLVV